MLTANFKDKPFKDIIVHRGEVVISHMRLAETLDKSKEQIRRLLNKLKRTNDITTTRIGCATLVRLINYNKYQGFEDTTPAPTATCPPDESIKKRGSISFLFLLWWAQMDSNQRPDRYERPALTN